VTPSGPTDLVLEELRSIREEMQAMHLEMDAHFDCLARGLEARFDRLDAALADLSREVRSFDVERFAAIYKPNPAFLKFGLRDARIRAVAAALS
jgi:hypothetical protein